MIRRLLRTFGLATRGELRVAEDKLRTLRHRLETTTERLTRSAAAADQMVEARREDAKRYKARIAELEGEHQHRAARARDDAARTTRRIGALEQALRAREDELAAAAREETRLEQCVAAALRELKDARASLAAVEIKLSILESAANVLDRRTRADRPHQP